MKKLMIIATLAFVFSSTAGCHIADCWRWAWNSRFHPERNAPAAQPCVVVDPCYDPCVSTTTVSSAAPCTSCGTPAAAVPGPIVTQ